MIAAMRGYRKAIVIIIIIVIVLVIILSFDIIRAVITTSPKCSEEKMSTIKAYGAKLVVSPPGEQDADDDNGDGGGDE